MIENAHSNHPAVKLGRWLKQRRQEAGLVARVLAGQIKLSPAEYAEAEAGVVKWLGDGAAELIPESLSLSTREVETFRKLFAEASKAVPLKFEDLFKREDLEPVRLRRDGRKRATAAEKKMIVEAVFTPLA